MGLHSRSRWLIMITLFLLLLLHFMPAQAQTVSEIHVLQNQAVQKEKNKIAFSFQAESSAVIDRVTLIYGFSGHGCNADGTRWGIYISPGNQVQGGWEWDLERTGGLLTGLELWWQWEIQDQSGQKLLTDRQTLRVMDQSYKWKKLTEQSISLYWFEGNSAFGQKLMDIAVKSLDRLANEAGVESTGEISIVIFPSAEEMREQLVYTQEWAGGVAFGEYDLIMIGISPADSRRWAEEVIPHEIAHLITENSFINCQAVRIPLWLNEGIAVYAEGPLSWKRRDQVDAALIDETLPALKTLRYTFPIDGDEADLAYSQSASVVTYLIDTYGVEKMHALVENIRSGKTIDQALRVIYGLNTDELDQIWRASLGYGEAPELNFTTETPEPTRTPIPKMDLHPSVWTPPSSTASVTATAIAKTSVPPTATAGIKKTATRIAPHSTAASKNDPVPPADAEKFHLFVNRVIGVLFAGLLVVAALAAVLFYRAIRPK